MKKISFSLSVLFFIAADIASAEKYVYYEKVFPDSSDIRTSFCRTKEAEFFESKGGAGECFNLSYQFETAYSLYSIKMSSANSGKLLLQGRINSSKTDKRDNTGIRVMDRKALNQTQTLILKYSTNELLLFDHMDEKLYTLHKFPRNKKVFLTREMTLRYVGEHFSYEDEKVFSSEAMKLILIKDREFQSNDYTILSFDKGNVKLQDFKPVYDLMDVFTLDNELYIDVSCLKVYSDKKVPVE